MPDAEPGSVTSLLVDWRNGDRQAVDRLIPLVYDELRRMAGKFMTGERRDHTLQATALVHEAYVRLVDADVPFQDRAHFFSVAASAMRRLLVDHARSHRRAKRGGDAVKVTLEEAALVSSSSPDVVLAIDQALERLAELDARKARAIELTIFGGMTQAEIASLLQVSVPTIERDLRMARAWIHSELNSGDRAG